MEETLARIARRQHALITRSQAVSAGYTPAMIRTRVKRGRWQPLAPDVFLLSGAPVDWPTKVMAACLATRGVASHRSAAVLLGVDGFRPGRVEISVERSMAGSRVAPDGVIVHRSQDLAQGDVVHRDSIPTTGPARLAVDLGAVVRWSRFEQAMDDLVGRRLLTWEAALDSLFAHARRGRNGVGSLRLLLEERWGADIPESELERAFLRLLRSRGLPEPVTQHELFDADGFIARVDVAYVDERVAIELDGLRWHLPAGTFESDHRKRARLQAAGWTVLAFTWRMLMEDPSAVIRSLYSVLGRQRAQIVHFGGQE